MAYPCCESGSWRGAITEMEPPFARWERLALPDGAPELAARGALPVQEFTDPDETLSFPDQLLVINDIWSRLCFRPPELTEPIQARVRSVVEQPGYRFLMAPLLGKTWRTVLDHRAREEFSLATRYTPIPWDRESGLPGRLIERSGMVADMKVTANGQGGSSYMLGYRSPSGAIVTRSEFKRELVEHGLAAGDEGGPVWSWLIINLKQLKQPGDAGVTVGKLYEEVAPSATAESFMLLGVVYGIAGEDGMPPEGQLNIVNEAVYTVSPEGTFGEAVDVGAIEWYRGHQMTSFYRQNTPNNGGNFRVARA